MGENKELIKSTKKDSAFTIISAVLALITGYTATYFLGMENETNIFILLLIVGIYEVYKNSFKCITKRRVICSTIFAVLFSICYVLGKSFEGSTIAFLSLKNLCYFIILTIFMTFLTNLAYNLLENVKNTSFKILDYKRFYIIIFIIFVVTIIPTFLTVYPGNIQTDTYGVLLTFLSNTISSYQPILYTLVWGGFYELGQAINNVNLGVALFNCIQIIFLCFAFTYTVYIINKNIKNKYLTIASILFFGLCPLIPIMATSVIKDTWFAAFFLLFFAMTFDIMFNHENKTKKSYIPYVISGILMCLLRNQGIYIIVFIIMFFAIFYRKDKRLLISLVLVAVLSVSINKILFIAVNGEKGRVAEMLSVPIQQLARAYNYNPDSFTDEEKETLYKYLPEEVLGNYISEISDPIKNYFNEEYFSEDKLSFVKLWISIGVKNVSNYVTSFLYGSYAYFYVDVDLPHWGTLFPSYNTLENQLANYGIISDSKFESNFEQYNGYLTEATYQDNYLLGILASPAVPFVLAMFDLIYCIYIKKYKFIAPLMMIIGLWGTLILGPVISVRYAFPLIICVPLLFCINFRKN